MEPNKFLNHLLIKVSCHWVQWSLKLNGESTKKVLFVSLKGFPGGSDGKESACSVGDMVWSLGWEDPLEGGHGYLLHYSCLEKPHGQRSLAGYSPRGHKGSDMTEWLSFFHCVTKTCRYMWHLKILIQFDLETNKPSWSILKMFITFLLGGLTLLTSSNI